MKYKAHVTKNIVMTKNLKIMNLYKIFIQNKEFRIFMDPIIFTRNSENIDLFMNSQLASPTVPTINHTQRSIQQSTFLIKFVFIGVSITDLKRNRNMSLKHKNKTRTRVAASDRKSVGSPSIWRRRKHFWPKIRSDSESGNKKFWKSDPL